MPLIIRFFLAFDRCRTRLKVVFIEMPLFTERRKKKKRSSITTPVCGLLKWIKDKLIVSRLIKHHHKTWLFEMTFSLSAVRAFDRMKQMKRKISFRSLSSTMHWLFFFYCSPRLCGWVCPREREREKWKILRKESIASNQTTTVVSSAGSVLVVSLRFFFLYSFTTFFFITLLFS